MEVAVGAGGGSTAGSEARIEVAASEISAAPGTSIIIFSYINLEAIFFLPSLLQQTQTQIKNGCLNSK